MVREVRIVVTSGREGRPRNNASKGSPGNFLGLLILFSIFIWVVATYAANGSSVLKICALFCMKNHTFTKFFLKGSTMNYQREKRQAVNISKASFWVKEAHHVLERAQGHTPSLLPYCWR